MATVELSHVQEKEDKIFSQLKRFGDGVHLLDPKNGKLENDKLLKKVSPDAQKQLSRLRQDVESTQLQDDLNLRFEALKKIEIEMAPLILKLEQVISDEYENAEKEFAEKKTKLETSNQEIISLFRDKIQPRLDIADPTKNNGATSQKLWKDKFLPFVSTYGQLRSDYELAINITSIDAQVGVLESILVKGQKLVSDLEAMIGSSDFDLDAIIALEQRSITDTQGRLEQMKNKTDYEKRILDALPGEDIDEKKWNYRLLQAYSDMFETENVPVLRKKTDDINDSSWLDFLPGYKTTREAFRDYVSKPTSKLAGVVTKATGFDKEKISLMGSIQKAAEGNGHNTWLGITDRQGEFMVPGAAGADLKRTSGLKDVAETAQKTSKGVLLLTDVAEYANNVSTLAPIYFSVVREHYVTMLVRQDQQNGDTKGRDSLPKGAQKIYDAIKLEDKKFTWNGLDSAGLDADLTFNDQFTFANSADKMIFLESSMKLLPYFDNLDEKYISAKLNTLEKIIYGTGDLIGFAADAVAGAGDNFEKNILPNIISEGGAAALGIYASLKSPNAFLLGRLLAMLNVRPNDSWDNLPLMWMIFKFIREARLLAMVAGPIRWVGSKLGSANIGLLNIIPKSIEGTAWIVEKIGGGDGKSSVGDYWNKIFKVASQRTIDMGDGVKVRPVIGDPDRGGTDIAVEKLGKDASGKRYKMLIDIIDARIRGPVSLPSYDGDADAITLSQISPEFGSVLKALVRNHVHEDYCAQAIERKGASKEDKENFAKSDQQGFILSEKIWAGMINDTFASENLAEQFMTANLPDTSNLNSGLGRIFGNGTDAHHTPGTTRNFLRNWYSNTIGNAINAYTWRFNMPWRIPGLTTDAQGNLRDPAQIYHDRIGLRSIIFGRSPVARAGIYIDQLVQHAPDDLDTALVDGHRIEHEGEELLKNNTFFDRVNEKELLENFVERYSHGNVSENGWKCAVVAMAAMCRGSEGDLTDAQVTAHDSVGIEHYESLYETLSGTEQGKIDEAYQKILHTPAEADKQLKASDIIKMARLTQVLQSNGGADGILDNGKARPLITALEKSYFDLHNIEHDASGSHDNDKTKKMEEDYDAAFIKHAKEYGEGYDPKKHLSRVKMQYKVLCHMARNLLPKAGQEHYTNEHDFKHQIESYITSQSNADFSMDITAFDIASSPAHEAYTEMMKKLVESAKEHVDKTKDKKTEFEDISEAIQAGALKKPEDCKTRVDAILLGLTNDQKIALADTMGIPEANRGNATTATAALVEKYKGELKLKTEALHDAIKNPTDTTDPRILLAEVRAYREYPHSSVVGKQDVQKAYRWFGEKLKALEGTPKEYYELYEHYRKPTNNPENGAAEDKGLTAGYENILSEGEKMHIDFRSEARDALTDLFKEGKYQDFNSMQSQFSNEVVAIERKYGAKLCKEGTTDYLKNARDDFAKFKASHQAAQTILENIERGTYRRPTDEAAELASFRSQNVLYLTAFGNLFNAQVRIAKNTFEANREASRIPATPSSAPENLTESIKNEMTELELTEAYKNYQADSANNDKYDALILEMSQGKYSNLRACYRCADRVVGNEGLNKYSPVQILTMLKASTIDASGTVVLALPAGDTINKIELESVFGGNISPVGLMMKMDTSGIGRSSVELRATGTNNEKFELHIRR